MNATKLRDVLRGNRHIPFFNKINLWSIVDQVAVGVDLQMTAGFELFNHSDVSLKNDDEITLYLQGIRRLLHSLPEDATLQFIVQAREGDRLGIESYSALNRQETEPGSFAETVIDSRMAFLKKKYLLKRRYFLFLTTWSMKLEQIPQVRLGALYDRHYKTITEAIHQTRVRQLGIAANSLKDSLRSMGVLAQRMDDQGLANYYYAHLNPTLSSSVPFPSLERLTAKGYTARSVLAQSAAEHRYEHLLIDGLHHKGVNLLVLPEQVDAFSLHHLSNHLWPDYDLCLTIFSSEVDQHIKRLESAKAWAGFFMKSKFMSRYVAAQKYEEIEQMVVDVKAGSQKIYAMSFVVLMKHKDPVIVEDNALTALKGFQDVGSALGVIDNLNHEDLYLSVLPNHSHFNSRQHVMNTDPLSYLIPLTAPWKGTAKPKMLFENPYGELVNFDLFDASLPAKHALLLGMTGSGKSFATNFLMTNFFVESASNHVIVIDVGGSYRKLTQNFGGQYFDVALSDEFAFNPFPEKRSIYDGKDFDPDELAYLTLIIELMALDRNESLNSLGETILEKAIKLAYKPLASNEAPILGDVRAAFKEVPGDDETKSLADHYYKNLEVWTDGRYSKVFNSRKRLHTDNRLIVFDLQKLGSHPRLQSVYFYVIRELIDGKLKNKALKKMIVVDEGWKFFNDEVGSRLIENLYRTARKNNGMVLSISQSPKDFLDTKAANAIITNSYVKYVLRLTKGHDLLPHFGLSDREIDSVKSLTSKHRTYSEIFVKFNEQSTILRLEPSPLDYWICTTDAEDEGKENRMRQEHPEYTHTQVLQALSTMSKEAV